MFLQAFLNLEMLKNKYKPEAARDACEYFTRELGELKGKFES